MPAATRYISNSIALFCFALLFTASPAYADCTDPAGVEGDQTYNLTYKTMMFCDGTTWNSMKAANAGLRNDCANDQVLKWDGSGWICAADDAGSGGSSIWRNDGPGGPAEIYYNGGNVGIGTDNPRTNFDVLSTKNYTGTTPASDSYVANLGNDGNGFVSIGAHNNQPAIQGQGTGTAYRLLLNPAAGNVGIGTSDPTTKLHVLKNSGGQPTAVFQQTDTSPNLAITDGTGGMRFEYNSAETELRVQTANPDGTYGGSSITTFQSTGNVGVGTHDPSTGLRLDVEGKVGATEYCDQNGANCTAAAALGGGGVPQGTQCGLAQKAGSGGCSTGGYTSVATCNGVSVTSSCPSGYTQISIQTGFDYNEGPVRFCSRMCIKN